MTRSARSLSGTLLSLRTEPVPGWSASRKLAAKMTARCRETVPSLGFPSFLLREGMDKPRNVDAKPIQQVVEGLINRCRLLFKGVENRSGVQFIQILKDRTGALCGDGIRGERGTGKILQVVGHDCFRTAADCCGKEHADLSLGSSWPESSPRSLPPRLLQNVCGSRSPGKPLARLSGRNSPADSWLSPP